MKDLLEAKIALKLANKANTTTNTLAVVLNRIEDEACDGNYRYEHHTVLSYAVEERLEKLGYLVWKSEGEDAYFTTVSWDHL